MQLQQRLPNQITKKSLKDSVYFQLENNHETIAKREKVEKNYRFKHEFEPVITFLFNFYTKLRRLKRLVKTAG